MLFNSYIFIFCFLPVTFILYFAVRHFEYNTMAKLVLIGMSLWFYGYFNYRYLLILLPSIFINYVLAYLINNCASRSWRKSIMSVGVFFNIGLIFYFKYFNFFIDTVNSVFGSGFELKNILLPLGISFFTFQQISFLVDSYRNDMKYGKFIDYVLYATFFPKLVSGPIVLYKEIVPQFNDKSKFHINYDNIANGLYMFAIGLFKKVLIAETFGRAVAWGYGSIESLTAMDAAIVMLSYTFQIYFDFSGYSDMALGIAKMFNIDLPQNFNSPYKSKSIIEFWSKWHMTLTNFLRTYIYFPLGGSRKGTVRTYVNILIIFLVSGLWHGDNWTFIVWGVLHGIANMLNRLCKKSWGKVNEIVQWMATFLFINITWVFFRANTMDQAMTLLRRIVGSDSTAISGQLMKQFILPEINFASDLPIFRYFFSRINGLSMWLFLIGALLIVLNLKNTSEIKFKSTVGRAVITIVFLVWSIVSFAGVSTFVYFNF
jgi:alginate O-acetyltransferase complex protein AlgI